MYLASDASTCTTGTVIKVDGGAASRPHDRRIDFDRLTEWMNDQGPTGPPIANVHRLTGGTQNIDRIDLHLQGVTESFTLASDPDGTLHGTDASPMEGGDKYVMTTKPLDQAGIGHARPDRWTGVGYNAVVASHEILGYPDDSVTHLRPPEVRAQVSR